MRRRRQRCIRARRDVGRDADVALAAAQHERNGGRIVAGIHGEVLWDIADEPLGPLDVSGCVLYTSPSPTEGRKLVCRPSLVKKKS